MAAASNYLELEFLDHALGTAAWTSPSNVYVQLHTGDPGETGASNVATENTRKVASFDAAASGSADLSSTLSWTSVAATETYSHWSIWDASTSGNCLFKGALDSSVAVTSGDNFDLTALTISAD